MNPDNRSGLVTLLFTDIEGSTRLWEQTPERMRPALARHDAVIRGAVEAQRGRIVKTVGDGVHAIFDDPHDGLAASIALQLALADASATDGFALHVRCGLHIGVVESRDNDVYGAAVNRASRISGAGHGGQILLSRAVAALVEDQLPEGVSLRDLGAVWLRDVAAPEQLFQVEHPLLRHEFPPPRSLRSNPTNLPQQITSFIGRERELSDVQRMLENVRVLTLLGTGGIGKTRLALQVATAVLDQYQDGVWYVELASIGDPALVPNALASVWGLHEEAGTPLAQTLSRHAQSRRQLVVLDNCEHLIDACAKLVASLAQSAAGLTILATSREPLRTSGEQLYALPALSVPSAKSGIEALMRADAARLFIERARLQLPDFAVAERQVPLVANICSRLDGIPLALELAAARVGALTLETLAARLDNRFGLLTGGDRTALPRQQTLRATLDWSYDLLDANEQTLFARLSAFAGGCTLDAAEAVCSNGSLAGDAIFDLMDHLVNKSLVMPVEAENRYRLAETVHDYAGVRLRERGEEAALRDVHATFYLALAEAAEPAWLRRTDETTWLSRLASEHANLKRALQWSIDQRSETDRALRLCGALGHYWRVRGHWREGRDWCNAALERSPATTQPSVSAKALLTCAMMNARLGETAEAEAQAQQALALARESGNRVLEAGALNNLSNIVADRGNFALAHELVASAVALNHELGNHAWEAINLANQGELFIGQGDFDAARDPLERALALSRRTAHRSLEAGTLGRMGLLAERRGELAEARALATAALTIYRELGAPAQEVEQLHLLASVAVACGETTQAARHFSEVLETSRNLGYRASIVRCLDGMVGLAARTGHYGQAARLHGAACALRAITGVRRTPAESEQAERMHAQCRAGLGESACDEATAVGRALTLEAAIDEGLAWLGQPMQA